CVHGIDFIQDLAVIFVAASLAGWVCQRLGLSVVVGYLAAGILVGPKTVLWPLVVNADDIAALMQIGLVFLMFGLGLRLSLRRLRQMGGAMFAAAGCTVLVMYSLSRLLGVTLGWNGTESLFLAGMLMVSSAVIISKVLHATGLTHERAGQLAMDLTMVEDIVAVVMLTLLSAVVEFGGLGHAASVGETLGLLGAFVALTGVAGLLVVPWLLRRLSTSASEELQTLGVAGMLFALALMAQRAGYSLALGAFWFGIIVAGTAHRTQVERTFEGMRDVFSALFFTAVGMQIDARALGTEAGLITVVAVFTLVARSLAGATGLILAGARPRDALRAGLAVTPIGEFSFIIAQLGVLAGVVSEKFYPLVVGVSLLTALAAPVLVRHGQKIVTAVAARQPRWLRGWMWFYFRGLERAARRRRESRLWQLCRRRFVQIGVEVLVVTGLLVFSEQLFAAVQPWLGRDWFFAQGPEVIFWTVLSLLVLAPLVAIWRNCSALALLYAQVATARRPREAALRPAVETGLKALVGAGMFVWLTSILPVEGSGKWLLLVSVLVAVVALLIGRRKFIYWHSELEVELKDALDEAGNKGSATSAPWIEPSEEWNLTMVDCVLPDLAECQGKSLHELGLRAHFGCTVVGIERQGIAISLPPPDAVLYPRDKVLLLGTPGQVAAGRNFLMTAREAPGGATFEDVRVETMKVPAWSQAAGRTLAELEPAHSFGVQVAGIRRGGVRILGPGADERLQAGDEMLVLGAPGQLRGFKAWLQAEPEDSLAAD
ncbi:MAG TPA: cation:proton antiporter, partial [Opitutaceae bacterium]|nr:cation:proton antiporter [Opitutaceae bacterium]